MTTQKLLLHVHCAPSFLPGLPAVASAINLGLLGLAWCLVLALKWHYAGSDKRLARLLLFEWFPGNPQRTSRVFALDCCKQAFAAFWLHLLNSWFLVYLRQRLPTESTDPCEIWWWTIVLDTTLGTALLWVLKQLAKLLLQRLGDPETAAFGEYKGTGTRIRKMLVTKQYIVFIILVTAMKVCMVKLHVVLGPFLPSCVSTFNPKLESFIAMTLTPGVMNAFQFLAIDTFISYHRPPLHKLPPLSRDDEPMPFGLGDCYMGEDQFVKLCMEPHSTRRFYGLDDFDYLEAQEQAAMLYRHADDLHRQATDESSRLEQLRRVMATQRQIVRIYNERLDRGGGSGVSRVQFLNVCDKNKRLAAVFGITEDHWDGGRRHHHVLKAFHRLSTRLDDAQPHIAEGPSESWAVSRETFAVPAGRLLALGRAIGAFGRALTAELGAGATERLDRVAFRDVHRFFRGHGAPPPEELRGKLDELAHKEEWHGGQPQALAFVAEESEAIEPEAQRLEPYLPKWGAEPLPRWSYSIQVARLFKPRRVMASRRATRRDRVPTDEGFHSASSSESEGAEEEAPPLERQVPSLSDCMGPAVYLSRLGVLSGTLAVLFMPVIAQLTMDCDPAKRGFGDHTIPSFGFLFDIVMLLCFVSVSLFLQNRIMKYVILGQLETSTIFQLDIAGAKINFSGERLLCKCCQSFMDWLCCGRRASSYGKWLALMQVLTALNLLNTWTNAEVLGRVLTTLSVCQDEGGDDIQALWRDTLRESQTFGGIDDDSSFLFLALAAYALILLQPLFAVIFSLPLGPNVTYKVGTDEEGHEGYRTCWEPTTGTNHKTAVQVLAALSTYEAVNFQDLTHGLVEMKQRLAKAEELHNDHLVTVMSGERVQVPRGGSPVAREVIAYLKELQSQLQRGVAKLMMVGLCQNAVQTKLQITFLSLDYNRKGEVDLLFGVGIFFNLCGYLFSIFDTIDFVKIGSGYARGDIQRIVKMLHGDYLLFHQGEELAIRRNRVCFAFCIGLLFSVLYLVFFVYLVVNVVMSLFVCDSRIWNLQIPLSAGCYVPP